MSRSRTIARAATVTLVAVGLTVLGILLWTQGLERADKLASVISMFLGTIALLVAFLTLWVTVRPRFGSPSREFKSRSTPNYPIISDSSGIAHASRYQVTNYNPKQVITGDYNDVRGTFLPSPAQGTPQPGSASSSPPNDID